MNIEKLILIIFIGSFLLPTLAFVAGRVVGVSAIRLAGVMVGFWILAIVSSIFASISLYQGSNLVSESVLISNSVILFIILVPRLISRPPKVLISDDTTQEIDDDIAVAKTVCVPRLVNQGGGTVPFTRSGITGNVGWYFGVANYYIWTLDLNVTATNSSATGTATASGQFSAWHSFSFTTRNASSTATGNVACERVEDKCVADARGGQDQDTDVDYTSAVVIKGSATGSKATLDVEVAVAVAGQVAISSIALGGSAKGVTVGVTINLPTEANDKKKIGRSYAYRCVEVEDDLSSQT